MQQRFFGILEICVLDADALYSGNEGRLKHRLIRASNEGLEAKPQAIYRGGTGLVSTAEDYLKFWRLLLGGGKLNGARILGAQGA